MLIKKSVLSKNKMTTYPLVQFSKWKDISNLFNIRELIGNGTLEGFL